jgi:Na+/proline symporter
VAIGLGAAAYIGAGRNHEQVLALFAEQRLPLPLYILFLGALVSAILSTLSGALLVAGSLAAHNVLLPLAPRLPEKAKLRANRWAVIAFGLIAYFIALSSESMYALVQQSSGLGSAGILIMMLFALWGGRVGGPASAYAALIAGTGVFVLVDSVLGLDGAYLYALGAALAGYLVCAPLASSMMSRRSSR